MSYLFQYPKNRLKHIFDEMEENFFSDGLSSFNNCWVPSLFNDKWIGKGYILPMVDVNETSDHIVVSADLPGLKKKDIEVSLKNNVLEIRGNKKRENSIRDRDFIHVEREFGSFVRQVPLPKEVVSGKVKAKYNNGVLEVMLLKKGRKKEDTARIKIEGQSLFRLRNLKDWFRQKFNKNWF